MEFALLPDRVPFPLIMSVEKILLILLIFHLEHQVQSRVLASRRALTYRNDEKEANSIKLYLKTELQICI